jgi:hypothetical protein
MIINSTEYDTSVNSLKLTISLLADPVYSTVAVLLNNPSIPSLQPILALAPPSNIATAFYSPS